MYRSVLDTVAPHVRARLSKGFSRVLEASDLSGNANNAGKFCLEGATVGDWWLARVRGQGSIRIRGELQADAMRERAMLTLVISGQISTEGAHEYFGQPSEVSLTRWDSFDDVRLSGNFCYMTLYVPVADLERLGAGAVPYTRVSTMNGAGGFTGSVFKAWVDSVLNETEPDAMKAVSDNFLRLVLDTLADPEAAGHQIKCASARRVDLVLTHLKANIADFDITPARVAQECGMSERQLYRDFAEQGMRFSTALRSLRLEAATARLLWGKDTPVSTIAYDCGFANPAYFARVFGQEYGESPRDYRNRCARH